MADQSKRVKERSLDAPLEDRALGVYWKVEGDELGFKSQHVQTSDEAKVYSAC